MRVGEGLSPRVEEHVVFEVGGGDVLNCVPRAEILESGAHFGG